MAGIGQRNTFDHPASWSSAAQLGMGRTMPNDSSKNLSNFPSGSDKRSLLNSTSGASVLNSFNSSVNFSYSSRTSSSTRSKGLTSTGGTLRTNYPDSSLDNGALYFPPYGHNPYSNMPQRGLSESSLLSGLGNINHSVNSDLSNLVSGLGSHSKSPIGSSVLGGPLKPSIVGNSGFFSSGSISSNSLLNAGVSSPGLNFDPSDFPPIVNSIGRSQGHAFPGSGLHRNYVSAISKGPNSSMSAIGTQSAFSNAVIQPPEFSIEQDFPALPVAQSTFSSSSTVPQNAMTLSSVANSIHSAQSLNAASGASLKNHVSQRLHRSHSGGSSYANSSPGGFLELLPDNLVANIPKHMICDQFGMIGLLKLIQIGCYDSTFEMLAPGLMLTSLGIVNWSQHGELHTSLASPCQESCMGRPQDMDYNVPPEYLIRHLVANRLPDPPLDHLSEETLFWLFYNCCREEVQLVSAKELYRRDWRFHKKEQLWLTRVVNADFSTDNASEQGVYSYWDPQSAEKMTREMKICYADLDDTPKNFHLSSNTLNAAVTTQPQSSVGSNAFAAAAYQQQQQQQQQKQQQQQAQIMSSSGGGAGNPLNSAFSTAHFPSSLLSAAAVVNNNGIGRPGARPTTKMSATVPPSSSSSSNNSQQQQSNAPALFPPTTVDPNNMNSEKMMNNDGSSKRNPSTDPTPTVASS